MKLITVPAKLEFLYEVIESVSQYARENDFKGEISHLELAVEEIFANIAAYTYPASEGKVEIDCWMEEDYLVIQFLDSGIAFNPLQQQDPDISLPAGFRPVGGLGIYFVKNCMDFVGYERREDKNILILKKQKGNNL